MSTDHSPETRLALVEQALQLVREAVDRMASKMVTHADLAAMATKAQMEALERRVSELEHSSPNRILATSTKILGAIVVAAAVWKLLRG